MAPAKYYYLGVGYDTGDPRVKHLPKQIKCLCEIEPTEVRSVKTPAHWGKSAPRRAQRQMLFCYTDPKRRDRIARMIKGAFGSLVAVRKGATG